jgi:hypothetical protein
LVLNTFLTVLLLSIRITCPAQPNLFILIYLTSQYSFIGKSEGMRHVIPVSIGLFLNFTFARWMNLKAFC